ncbi:LapA family protein [Thermodesulfobacterium hydrogeniphilum]|uniref:LapA family protein n=1 Tax=Thermodesulfobacterium hydrogeniphilum TaxID=161156 RepID=UPI00057052DC|nr:LapA family protein [Thermodesulfobacterium hydrogeniphilum]
MIFRLILWIVIILLIVFFVIFNVEPRVQVHLFPGATLENIPLALVIIISFILGLLSGVILSLSQIIKYKLEIRKLQKQNKWKAEIPSETKSEEETN